MLSVRLCFPFIASLLSPSHAGSNGAGYLGMQHMQEIMRLHHSSPVNATCGNCTTLVESQLHGSTVYMIPTKIVQRCVDSVATSLHTLDNCTVNLSGAVPHPTV